MVQMYGVAEIIIIIFKRIFIRINNRKVRVYVIPVHYCNERQQDRFDDHPADTYHGLRLDIASLERITISRIFILQQEDG